MWEWKEFTWLELHAVVSEVMNLPKYSYFLISMSRWKEQQSNFIFWRSGVQTSACRLSFLTETWHSISRHISEQYLKSGHNFFLSDPFQFIIY
jgi:hypothetical protein